MRKFGISSVLGLVAVLSAVHTPAQSALPVTLTLFGEGPKSASVVYLAQAQQPRPTIASVVDSEIRAVEKQILDVAEAMPEDKFKFSPESLDIRGSDYKGVRSFAVQLKHVAASNYFIWSPLTGDQLPEGLKDGDGPADLKTKADIVRFLKDSFALGHRAAATLRSDNMLQLLQGGKSTRLHRTEFGIAHAYDHYGQMVEYLRMNGIVPPASRAKPD
jgi:DinB family protein